RERAAIHGRDLDYADSADGTAVGGFDQGSSRTPIARVYGLTDRERFPGGRATFATPQSSPSIDAAVPHGNRGWNYQEESGFIPAERQAGLYLRASRELRMGLEGYAELAWRRSVIDIDSAST